MLEDGRVLVCVGAGVDPAVAPKVGVLVAFLVQQCRLGQLGLFAPVKAKLWVRQGRAVPRRGRQAG